MTQLRFISEKGIPLGVINWFAIHATSMNNSNTLVSSDNVGYASVKFEEMMNPGKIIGKVIMDHWHAEGRGGGILRGQTLPPLYSKLFLVDYFYQAEKYFRVLL